MKSLPEKFWNNLRSRLLNYSEEPDDDSWSVIAARIPSKHRGWTEWGGHFFTMISLATFLFLIEPGNSMEKQLTSSITESAENFAGAHEANKEHGASLDVKRTKEASEGDAQNKTAAVPRKQDVHETDPAGMGEIFDGKMSEKEKLRPRSGSENAGKRSKIDHSNAMGRHNKITENKNTQLVSPEITDTPKKSNQLKLPNADEHDETPSADEKTLQGFEANQIGNKELQNNKAGSLKTDATHSQPSMIVQEETKEDSMATPGKTQASDTIRVTTRDVKKRRSFAPMIYFAATPSLAYYRLTPDKTDAVLVTRMFKDGLISQNRLGIHLEAGFHQQLGKHFSLFGGGSYYSQHQSITYEYVGTTVEKIESSGEMRYILSPSTEIRNFNFSMRNAGVNAGVFYLLKEGKLSHHFGVGLQYQKAFVRYSIEADPERTTMDFFNYLLLYKMQLTINSKVQWFVQPSLTHTLLSQRLVDEPFEIKPYRIGIGLGFIYRF